MVQQPLSLWEKGLAYREVSQTFWSAAYPHFYQRCSKCDQYFHCEVVNITNRSYLMQDFMAKTKKCTAFIFQTPFWEPTLETTTWLGGKGEGRYRSGYSHFWPKVMPEAFCLLWIHHCNITHGSLLVCQGS